MNALDLLYSAAAHSGSSERGQQRSDSHAERNEQDTMRAYAVEQMRSQQEAEERALSRAAAGLTIGGVAGGQAGALPTPAPIPPSAAIVWGSFERNTGTWCGCTSPMSPLHLPCIPCVRGWLERNRSQSPPTPTPTPARTPAPTPPIPLPLTLPVPLRCPYPDSAKIETAYQRGDADIFLPE